MAAVDRRAPARSRAARARGAAASCASSGKAPVHILLIVDRAALARADDRPLLTSLLARRPVQRAGLVEGLLRAEPRDLATTTTRSSTTTRSRDSLITTLEIAIGGTVLPILVAALAGYAFAWLEFPGRDWLFIVVIALLVVPLQMALIPIFSLYNTLGIFDTVLGLILFHTAFGLPFAIFLLRNFFIGIPKDILESARIDGASELRIFLRLILPLGLPAIASLAIFQFLWTWNDLLVALTFGARRRSRSRWRSSRSCGSSARTSSIIAPASFVSLAIPLARLLRLPALLRAGPAGRLGQVARVRSTRARWRRRRRAPRCRAR